MGGENRPEAGQETFGEWVWGLIFRFSLPVLLGLPVAAGLVAGDFEAARQVAWWEVVFIFGMAPFLVPLWYGAWAIAVGLLDAMGWSEDDKIGPARRCVLTLMTLSIEVLLLWLLVLIRPWFQPGDGSSPGDDRDRCEVSRVFIC